jgi:hypothetical protein
VVDYTFVGRSYLDVSQVLRVLSEDKAGDFEKHGLFDP